MTMIAALPQDDHAEDEDEPAEHAQPFMSRYPVQNRLQQAPMALVLVAAGAEQREALRPGESPKLFELGAAGGRRSDARDR